eukprot:SM000312S11984  [mRNA]  locus=s312:51924:57373:+ [translate_table: standard]
MSRICVKNVPPYVQEGRLKDHFAARGEVTDARILRTSPAQRQLTRSGHGAGALRSEGKSRQLAFVGYRSEEEAAAAIKYFNRSFLDTCRLTCELARPVGEATAVRPWSRHSEGSSAYSRAHEPQQKEHGAKEGKAAWQPLPASGSMHGSRTAGSAEAHGQAEDDPQLHEFLEVMQPRKKSRLWTNDDVLEAVEGSTQTRKQAPGGGKQKVLKGQRDGVNAGRQPGMTAAVTTSTVNASKSKRGKAHRLQVNGAASSAGPVEGSGDVTLAGAEAVGLDTVDTSSGSDAGEGSELSDAEYLRSRVRTDWSDDEDHEHSQEAGEGVEEEEEEEQDEEEEESAAGREVTQEESAEQGKAAESSGVVIKGDPQEIDNIIEPSDGGRLNVDEQSGRLFVRNLCYSTTDDDLLELFGVYGKLSEVHVVVDRNTRRSKGFAYVLYMLPENARIAMHKLDKTTFQGRLLHILPAKRAPAVVDREESRVQPGSTIIKAERDAKRKAAESEGKTAAWSSLFMRADTVAENVAKKYGVSKSELLDPSADDLAVRMALGETHIIAETKQSLAAEGVDVSILEGLTLKTAGSKSQRSNNVILVKNLPFSTDHADLAALFDRYSSLGRLILPTTKTLAIVEFLEASQARAAFKALAYKRFKHVPLYLEWAPEGLLSAPSKGLAAADATGHRAPLAKEAGEGQVKRIAVVEDLEMDDEAAMLEARSLFVKNLNFTTTEAALRQQLEQKLPNMGIRSIVIKKKAAKTGQALSMGFGFVECSSSEMARDALKKLKGLVVDGHALVLQLSQGSRGRRAADAAPSSSREAGAAIAQHQASSTKLIVRNVAFEATKKDLRQLFDPFGQTVTLLLAWQVKTLRLPKKFDGSHRGFAFVEFVTRQEAQNAFDALQNSHLYGRHLVLERAKEGEGIEDLRTRTAAHFAQGGLGVGTVAARAAKKRKQQDMLVDDAAMSFHDIAAHL